MGYAAGRVRIEGMKASNGWVTTIVLVHLAVAIVHGKAHSELLVGLTSAGMAFVVIVVLILPLMAMVLSWRAARRLGLILLSLSMFAALVFGVYHHFLIVSPDHVSKQPSGPWGITFVATAVGLAVTELAGAYVGVHFLIGQKKNLGASSD